MWLRIVICSTPSKKMFPNIKGNYLPDLKFSTILLFYSKLFKKITVCCNITKILQLTQKTLWSRWKFTSLEHICNISRWKFTIWEHICNIKSMKCWCLEWKRDTEKSIKRMNSRKRGKDVNKCVTKENIFCIVIKHIKNTRHS